MGHAGAFVGPNEVDAHRKIQELEQAGVMMIDHPAKFGNSMCDLLSHRLGKAPVSHTAPLILGLATLMGAGKKFQRTHNETTNQRRSIHTYRYQRNSYRSAYEVQQPRRSLHIASSQALDILKLMNVPIFENTLKPIRNYDFCITVDRTQCRPYIIAEQVRKSPSPDIGRFRTSFPYNDGLRIIEMDDMVRTIGLPKHLKYQLHPILESLVSVFKQKEAFLIKVRVVEDRKKQLSVHGAQMTFDDSAFRVGKRNLDIEKLRRVEIEDADEVEAESHGIAYIK